MVYSRDISKTRKAQKMANHFQEVCETHNITTEQGDIIMRMGYMTAFMNGWFGEKKQKSVKWVFLKT